MANFKGGDNFPPTFAPQAPLPKDDDDYCTVNGDQVVRDSAVKVGMANGTPPRGGPMRE